MLSIKEKNLLLISNILTIVISLFIIIPFHRSGVAKWEIVLKSIVAPIIVFILALINIFTKHENYRPSNKYLMVTAYGPILSFICASLFYALLINMRTTLGYQSFGFGWFFTTTLLVGLIILSFYVAHAITRWLVIFTKNESMVIDFFIFIGFIVIVFLSKTIADRHVNIVFEAKSVLYVLMPLLFGLLFGAFHLFRLLNLKTENIEYSYTSKRDILSRWIKSREDLYDQAEVDVLYSLYTFTKKELQLEDELDEVIGEINEEISDIINEQITEISEQVIEEALKLDPVVVTKVVEVVDQGELDKIQAELARLEIEKEQLEADKARASVEIAKLVETKSLIESKKEEVEVIIKPKKVVQKKEKKVFQPSFEELIAYVHSIPNVIEKSNAARTNIRFYIDKKQFLALAETNSDYRITFLYDLEAVVALIVDKINVVKTKSPVGDHWFKLINKGNFSEEELFDIIDKSHIMLELIESRKRAEKEQARLAKLNAKKKLKPVRIEKTLIQSDELTEQVQPMVQISEEQEVFAKLDSEAALKAQKEREKEASKLRAQKEKEAAKLKAQKEREKEAAKLKAQKEKEAAKLKAQKEKEKEAAKLKAQKEKEAAKLKTQKEKEKEAAKLKAQKEKEAAKLKAQKEKEKEAAKLKAQKEKEKEAAKLKAQKEKEKEAAKLAAKKEEEKDTLPKEEVA